VIAQGSAGGPVIASLEALRRALQREADGDPAKAVYERSIPFELAANETDVLTLSATEHRCLVASMMYFLVLPFEGQAAASEELAVAAG
jgi:hypothetical protein